MASKLRDRSLPRVSHYTRPSELARYISHATPQPHTPHNVRTQRTEVKRKKLLLKQPWQCDKCKKCFHSEVYLALHLATHVTTDQYVQTVVQGHEVRRVPLNLLVRDYQCYITPSKYHVFKYNQMRRPTVVQPQGSTHDEQQCNGRPGKHSEVIEIDLTHTDKQCGNQGKDTPHRGKTHGRRHADTQTLSRRVTSPPVGLIEDHYVRVIVPTMYKQQSGVLPSDIQKNATTQSDPPKLLSDTSTGQSKYKTSVGVPDVSACAPSTSACARDFSTHALDENTHPLGVSPQAPTVSTHLPGVSTFQLGASTYHKFSEAELSNIRAIVAKMKQKKLKERRTMGFKRHNVRRKRQKEKGESKGEQTESDKNACQKQTNDQEENSNMESKNDSDEGKPTTTDSLQQTSSFDAMFNVKTKGNTTDNIYPDCMKPLPTPRKQQNRYDILYYNPMSVSAAKGTSVHNQTSGLAETHSANNKCDANNKSLQTTHIGGEAIHHSRDTSETEKTGQNELSIDWVNNLIVCSTDATGDNSKTVDDVDKGKILSCSYKPLKVVTGTHTNHCLTDMTTRLAQRYFFAELNNGLRTENVETPTIQDATGNAVTKPEKTEQTELSIDWVNNVVCNTDTRGDNSKNTGGNLDKGKIDSASCSCEQLDSVTGPHAIHGLTDVTTRLAQRDFLAELITITNDLDQLQQQNEAVKRKNYHSDQNQNKFQKVNDMMRTIPTESEEALKGVLSCLEHGPVMDKTSVDSECYSSGDSDNNNLNQKKPQQVNQKMRTTEALEGLLSHIEPVMDKGSGDSQKKHSAGDTGLSPTLSPSESAEDLEGLLSILEPDYVSDKSSGDTQEHSPGDTGSSPALSPSETANVDICKLLDEVFMSGS